jgi:formylglycine-generating enzyme required for sulfatase activity
MNCRFHMQLPLIALICILMFYTGCDTDESCCTPDTSPPGIVADLTKYAHTDSSIALHWTTPGDDGSEGRAAVYDLRYSAAPGTSALWWDSMAVSASDLPVPGVAGGIDSFTVGGLLAETVYFLALKVSDESDNWSLLSNVCVDTTATAEDITPPAAIIDLSVVGVTHSSVGLTWLSPGDDENVGSATEYDVRYSIAPILDVTWDDAVAVESEIVPSAAGEHENLTIYGLEAETTYYFGIVTTDDSSNTSELSNVCVATTASEPTDLVISTIEFEFDSENLRRIFTIRNLSTEAFNWSIEDEYPWLTIEPVSGNTTTETDTVSVIVFPGMLGPGAHNYSITIQTDRELSRNIQLVVSGYGSGFAPDEVVLVQNGSYFMGSAYGGAGRDVTLSRNFYLGVHEVTNLEYLEALQWAYDNGYVLVEGNQVLDNLDGSTEALYFDYDSSYYEANVEIRFDGDRSFYLCMKAPWYEENRPYDPSHRPIAGLTWFGAACYCDWLSMQAGLPRAYLHTGDWTCNDGNPYTAYGYRLPTEAEWAYAASFNDNRQYPWGNEFSWDEAAFSEDLTSPVGSFPAAPQNLGLYDLVGNAEDWCNDWLADLSSDPVTDPVGPDTPGHSQRRVHRGGSYSDWGEPGFCNSCRTGRWYPMPGRGLPYRGGLRIARTDQSMIEPILEISESQLSFGSIDIARNLEVRNTGRGTLSWGIVNDPDWVSISPGSGNLGAGEVALVNLTVDRSGLALGNYSTELEVAGNGQQATILVEMSVASNPLLTVEPVLLAFNEQIFERSVAITNTGVGTLDWRVATSVSWLQASPSTGTITTEIDQVIVTVNGTGLATGLHHGELTVIQDSKESVTVDVIFNVNQGDMVLVESGNFTMGTNEFDGLYEFDCSELHPVSLTRDFYIGKSEITNRIYLTMVQWAYDEGYVTVSSNQVVDNLDGSNEVLLVMDPEYCEIYFDGDGLFNLQESQWYGALRAYPNGYDPADHPVIGVTWYGAARCCDWLSKHAGLERAYQHNGDWSCNNGAPYDAQGYRLPTDAEWEYATQVDGRRRFPWGDEDPDCSRLNFFYDHYPGDHPCIGWTVPAGRYSPAPSIIGLYDMAGNVREWCNDIYECLESDLAKEDPVGPAIGDTRLLHGGYWQREPGADGFPYLHFCALRDNAEPAVTDAWTGFRIVRTN